MTGEETISAVIRDLSHDGLGIADVDGRRLFVAGALPGEAVLVRPGRRRRSYREAELAAVTQAAPGRVEPGCEFFGRCGGCALQHLRYESQLEFKQKVVADAFATIAKLEPDEWLEPITGPQWGYRRRARLGIKYVAGKGRVLVGFRERAAPFITDMSHCPVLVERIGTRLGDLATAVGETSIRDRIPQAEISIGDEHGAIVVRVLSEPSATDTQRLREFGRLCDLDVYLQPAGPDSIFPLVENPAPLGYRLPSFDLRIGFEPNDFIQVNAVVNEAMVSAAIDSAGLRPDDRVLDLYCGLGNITLPIAGRVREVVGVEGDAALVTRGARNAEANGVRNARFLTADLEAPDWPFFREQWDVVFLDPARAGASAAAVSMARMRPRRVIYVSCHAGTLARDAATLVREQGYALDSVRILDMFPNTHHVEAIAVFTRR